jgi:GH35 family endo-1,4-beta-xylanase
MLGALAKTHFNISIWDIHMLRSPEETRKLRFKYLYELYKVAMENAENSRFERNKFAVDRYEVGNRLNLNRNTVYNIVEYLKHEGLVHGFGLSPSRGMAGYSGITKLSLLIKVLKR